MPGRVILYPQHQLRDTGASLNPLGPEIPPPQSPRPATKQMRAPVPLGALQRGARTERILGRQATNLNPFGPGVSSPQSLPQTTEQTREQNPAPTLQRNAISERILGREATDTYLWYMGHPRKNTPDHLAFIENYEYLILEIARKGNIPLNLHVVDVLWTHISQHNSLVTNAIKDFPRNYHTPWMYRAGLTRLDLLLLELAHSAESERLNLLRAGGKVADLLAEYLKRIKWHRKAACASLAFMVMSRLILFQKELNPICEPANFDRVKRIISQRNHHWVFEVLEGRFEGVPGPYFFDDDKFKLIGMTNLYGQRLT